LLDFFERSEKYAKTASKIPPAIIVRHRICPVERLNNEVFKYSGASEFTANL
jgi:hypothetical protein